MYKNEEIENPIFLANNGKVENKDFYVEEIGELKNELQNLNHRYLQSESDRQKAEMKVSRVYLVNHYYYNTSWIRFLRNLRKRFSNISTRQKLNRSKEKS